MVKKRLEEIGEIINGGTPSTQVDNYWGGSIPWITPYDLSNNNDKWISYGDRNISKEGFENSNAKIIPSNSIMISTRAPVGYVVRNRIDATTNQGMKSFIPDLKLVDANYMYYFFVKNNELLNMRSGGTTFRELSTTSLKAITVDVPEIKIQKEIGTRISVFDDKISLNNQLITSLNEYSQLIFHKWFVDFNFPNKEGKSYKDNNGKMYEVDGKVIPDKWKLTKIGAISQNNDSKRIPLSDSERTERKGKYPYYGATHIMDYIDDYLFDGFYCLIAEDGSVIDEENKPIMQLAWSRFWVNNHAHVLQGKNGVSTEYLYLTLKRTNVMGAVTGAIQKKINQQNLNKLPAILPKNEVLYEFNNLIIPIFKKIMLLVDEIKLLEETRDLLIKKLIK